jgi:hypothetical protein
VGEDKNHIGKVARLDGPRPPVTVDFLVLNMLGGSELFKIGQFGLQAVQGGVENLVGSAVHIRSDLVLGTIRVGRGPGLFDDGNKTMGRSWGQRQAGVGATLPGFAFLARQHFPGFGHDRILGKCHKYGFPGVLRN